MTIQDAWLSEDLVDLLLPDDLGVGDLDFLDQPDVANGNPTIHAGSGSTASGAGGQRPSSTISSHPDSGGPSTQPGLSRQERKRLSQLRMRQRRRDELAQAEAQLRQLTSKMQSLSVQNSQLKLKADVLQGFVDHPSTCTRAALSKRRNQDAGGPAQSSGNSQPAASSPAGLPGEGLKQAEPTLTPEEVAVLKGMSVDGFVGRWKQLLQKMSRLLLECPDDGTEPTPTAQSQLHTLVAEARWLVLGTALTRPEFLRDVMAMNIERMKHEDAPPAFWTKVVQHLRLRQEQLDIVCAGWEVYQRHQGAVQAEQQELSQQLQLSASETPGTKPGVWDPPQLGQDPGFLEAAQQLERSLWREELLHRMMCGSFVEHVLTPVQNLLMFVHSFPYLADPVQLVQAVVGRAEGVRRAEGVGRAEGGAAAAPSGGGARAGQAAQASSPSGNGTTNGAGSPQ